MTTHPRRRLLSLVAAIGSWCAAFAPHAYSATHYCEIALTPADSATRGGYSTPKILAGDKNAVRDLLAQYGVTFPEKGHFDEVIRKVYEKVDESAEPAAAKSEKLAKFGVQLEPYFKRLPKDERKTVNTLLALAVMRIDSYKPEEFSKVANNSWAVTTANPPNAIYFNQYLDWTKSYVDNTAPYANAPGGGLLSQAQIRDFETHNLWPVYLRPHDMNHAFWALSHPRGAAMIFEASRAKEAFRYVVISAMYEGVDTVQFYQETSLARYMKNTRKMDLEDAMIYLSRIPLSELRAITDASGTTGYFDGLAAQFSSWAPTYSDAQPRLGRDGASSFESETDHMITSWRKYAADESLKKYLRYRKDLNDNSPIGPDTIHKSGEASKTAEEIAAHEAELNQQ